MQDQVAALQQVGVRAAFLNSTLTQDEVQAVESTLLDGELDLLYVAPERLLTERTLKAYLLSLDVGFLYYMVKPEVQQIAPYIGGGFSGFIPMERLETTMYTESGDHYPNPNETISENSFEVGVHGEFGIVYYITNRYTAGLEGRYQKSQSKFTIHGGNFDVDYSGLTLSLVLQYFF